MTRIKIPHLECLEERLVPAPVLVMGAEAGQPPLVRVFDENDQILFNFLAFEPRFRGGVNAVLGDVDGDGVADIITGAGAGGGPHVKVFSGQDLTVLASFFAFDPGFTGGVFVGTGDPDGDGQLDVVAGIDSGSSPRITFFEIAGGSATQLPDPTGNNVLTYVTGTGDLFLLGDLADNEVQITPGATADQFILHALNDTRINGQSVYVAGGVTNTVRANLKGGDDFIGLRAVAVPEFIRVTARSGNDTIYLSNVEMGNDLRLFLKYEDNIVALNAQIGGRLNVKGTDGDQSFLFKNSQVEGETRIRLRAGADRVGAFDSFFRGDMQVRLGKNDDQMWFEGNTVLDSFFLDGGNGAHDETTTPLPTYNTISGPLTVVNFDAVTELLEEVEFGYEPGIGPDAWASLTPDYLLAVVGREQSGVNIITADTIKSDLVNLVFNYQFETGLNFFNTGENISVAFAQGPNNTVTDKDGTVFQLQQFHLHTESEHAVNGTMYGGELHLVHQNPATGELLVVAVLLEADPGATPSGAYLELLNNLPTEVGTQNGNPVSLSALDLLPTDRRYYAYSGSLTTPPNSEAVRWRVLADPVQLTPDQLDAITQSIAVSELVGDHGNNRPIQPLNSREVLEDIS